MKISKKDALTWFRFFAEYPEEELSVKQQDIAYSAFYQLEKAVEKRRKKKAETIKGLKSLDGRTYFVGNEEKFAKGCRSCLLGTGLSAVRKTNRCNIECRFCYNYGELDKQPPIGEGLWEIGGTRFYEEDLELLFSVNNLPTGIAYVYLEPFMEIEKYYSVIKKFSEAGVYQHLYTNGTLVTEENLKALGDCGLNELRFNLGATNCSDRVIENIAKAKKYIPMVGIETPMTPEFFEAFSKKKEVILSTGLDFINCAELHLNGNNIENYYGEEMYMCRLGYISPIWSGDLILDFMKRADDEGWPVAVHGCTNRTKFARDLNLRAKEGGWFGASSYGCEFETPPFEFFISALEDEKLLFEEEEAPPAGFGFDDIVL